MKSVNQRKPVPILRRSQEGIVLIVALIVLVAMTTAGIAMVKQMSTGLVVAGNLALRQNASNIADFGIEQARAWLKVVNAGALINDGAGGSAGYFATAHPEFNPATHAWSDANSQLVADAGLNHEVRYVIHRICEFQADGTHTGQALDWRGNGCYIVERPDVGSSRGASLGLPTLPSAYFRITARALGPRNATSYVQVMVY